MRKSESLIANQETEKHFLSTVSRGNISKAIPGGPSHPNSKTEAKKRNKGRKRKKTNMPRDKKKKWFNYRFLF